MWSQGVAEMKRVTRRVAPGKIACVGSLRDWSASSLGERMRWAIDRTRTGVNELGESSGTSGGAVSKLLARADRVAGRAETLEKLAQALDVSVSWLAFGLGQPLDENELTPRERAAALCREHGVSEAAIQSVLSEVVIGGESISTIAWIDRMRLREAELRSM